MGDEISRSNPGQRGNTPLVPSWMKRWRLVSSFDLPFRLKREYADFAEAYHDSCEWNRLHDTKDMCSIEEVP
jgi:hypothetical protein